MPLVQSIVVQTRLLRQSGVLTTFRCLPLACFMSKHPKMTDRDYERSRTDQIIAERFTTSCMSDAKWLRLLDALTATDGLVADCRAKLVWDDRIRYMQIDGMRRDFDYWPHAMEAMISGIPRGWYDYKEIEWIEFPSRRTRLPKNSFCDRIGRAIRA